MIKTTQTTTILYIIIFLPLLLGYLQLMVLPEKETCLTEQKRWMSVGMILSTILIGVLYPLSIFLLNLLSK